MFVRLGLMNNFRRKTLEVSVVHTRLILEPSAHASLPVHNASLSVQHSAVLQGTTQTSSQTDQTTPLRLQQQAASILCIRCGLKCMISHHEKIIQNTRNYVILVHYNLCMLTEHKVEGEEAGK